MLSGIWFLHWYGSVQQSLFLLWYFFICLCIVCCYQARLSGDDYARVSYCFLSSVIAVIIIIIIIIILNYFILLFLLLSYHNNYYYYYYFLLLVILLLLLLLLMIMINIIIIKIIMIIIIILSLLLLLLLLLLGTSRWHRPLLVCPCIHTNLSTGTHAKYTQIHARAHSQAHIL